MLRATDLSSLRSCVRATSVYSIVQAKVLSHFLRSKSATLSFAKAFYYFGGQIVVLDLIDVIKDHLADVEGLGAPGLFCDSVETTLDFLGKSNGSGHGNGYLYSMYSLYHARRGVLGSQHILRDEEHIGRPLSQPPHEVRIPFRT